MTGGAQLAVLLALGASGCGARSEWMRDESGRIEATTRRTREDYLPASAISLSPTTPLAREGRGSRWEDDEALSFRPSEKFRARKVRPERTSGRRAQPRKLRTVAERPGLGAPF